MESILSPNLFVLSAAIAVDFLLGEYPSTIHPVVWIGKAITLFESIAPRKGKIIPFLAGVLIAVGLPLACVFLIITLFGFVSSLPLLSLLLSVFFLKSIFALTALRRAAQYVSQALTEDKMSDARFRLRSLCSRDASRLEKTDLIGATIESVAENLSDSFVAPLFYYALFGLPGAVFYRVVNTLDARIGYHGKYEYLGKASARLDDVLNFIPARLTAIAILIGGYLYGKDFHMGWKILRRDGGITESPNAGRPMATMAGLLRVALEKKDHYRLGDPVEVLTVGKIEEALKIIHLAALLGIAFCLGIWKVGHL